MRNLVIVPTYNERENIQNLINRVLAISGVDLLIIDDNSPDGTGEMAERHKAQGTRHKLEVIRREKKMGLGSAYIEGFKYALKNGYDHIITMDADGSHNPEILPVFLEKAKEGFDLIIGSRYIKGGRIENWGVHRRLLSRFANLYVRVFTGLPVKDATGGFNCYARKVLEDIKLAKINSEGYAFQIEMKYKGWKQGFRTGEIPITFVERKYGKSKLSRGIIWEAFFLVWKLRLL